MARLAQTAGLTTSAEILSRSNPSWDKEIIPHAQALEHSDTYPQTSWTDEEMACSGSPSRRSTAPRRVAAHLCPRGRADCPWLDEPYPA